MLVSILEIIFIFTTYIIILYNSNLITNSLIITLYHIA
jgi:hypothetical protein